MGGTLAQLSKAGLHSTKRRTGTMESIGEVINQYILPHWPLLTVTLALAIFGQVLKGSVFSVDMCKRSRFCWWGRKTLPAHPVLIGLLIGFIPGMPVSPGVEGRASRVLYFMAAGVLSTWAFMLLKQFAKKRGIELDVLAEENTRMTGARPAVSTPPPPPPPPTP